MAIPPNSIGKALRQAMVAELAGIEGFEARASPVAGGMAFFFRGREFAHFHHDTELDLRLTRPLIRRLGLAHPVDSVQHPTRSPSSPWIELRFATRAEMLRVVDLVKQAIAQLPA